MHGVLPICMKYIFILITKKSMLGDYLCKVHVNTCAVIMLLHIDAFKITEFYGKTQWNVYMIVYLSITLYAVTAIPFSL